MTAQHQGPTGVSRPAARRVSVLGPRRASRVARRSPTRQEARTVRPLGVARAALVGVVVATSAPPPSSLLAPARRAHAAAIPIARAPRPHCACTCACGGGVDMRAATAPERGLLGRTRGKEERRGGAARRAPGGGSAARCSETGWRGSAAWQNHYGELIKPRLRFVNSSSSGVAERRKKKFEPAREAKKYKGIYTGVPDTTGAAWFGQHSNGARHGPPRPVNPGQVDPPLALHRALRRMAGLVFLLVFWVLAGRAVKNVSKRHENEKNGPIYSF